MPLLGTLSTLSSQAASSKRPGLAEYYNIQASETLAEYVYGAGEAKAEAATMRATYRDGDLLKSLERYLSEKRPAPTSAIKKH